MPLSPDELTLARERVKAWPLEERQFLTKLTEPEVELILTGVALLDFRPATDPLLRDSEPVVDTPHARRDDPRTSHVASAAIEDEEGPTSVIRPETLKHLALRELQAGGPRHAVGIERATGRRGIWKRVSDLKLAHLVDVVGTVRDDVTGKEGEVVQINDRGRAVLGELDAGRQVSLRL